jgi:hypothetical protein
MKDMPRADLVPRRVRPHRRGGSLVGLGLAEGGWAERKGGLVRQCVWWLWLVTVRVGAAG